MSTLSFLTPVVLLVALLVGCVPAAPATKVETPAAKAPVAPSAPTQTAKAGAEQPQYGGILKHAGLADEGTFDLHTTGRSLAFEQAGPGYNGLLQLDPLDNARIITDLAEKYEVSPDGKKVTFVLRKGVRWHDGKEFTSDDVKFNFERWMNPPAGVAITRKEIAAPVERVAAPDPGTVEIYMKYPATSFIPMIAMSPAVMLPPQYLKDHKTMEFNIIGTGPFKLKKYSRGVSVELEKNKDYFVPGRPYLDGIAQYLIPDEAARFASLRTGQVRTLHWSQASMTSSHTQIFRKDMSDKVEVIQFGTGVIGILYMNFTRPPFSDLRIRQAVDMVLDRKKALEVAEGRGEITGPMVRGPWGLPEDELLKRQGYRGVTAADIEKARSLLAEAGLPEGFQVEIPVREVYRKQALFAQDQLKAIKFDVSLRIIDTATMEQRLISHDFAMTVYMPGQPVDDPDLFLGYYATGGGRNYSGFTDKQVDELYQEQSKTLDAAKRKDIVFAIQRRVLDLAPAPILYHSLYESVAWKCVKAFHSEKQFGAYGGVKRQDVWLADGCR